MKGNAMYTGWLVLIVAAWGCSKSETGNAVDSSQKRSAVTKVMAEPVVFTASCGTSSNHCMGELQDLPANWNHQSTTLPRDLDPKVAAKLAPYQHVGVQDDPNFEEGQVNSNRKTTTPGMELDVRAQAIKDSYKVF